jgi:hypothetical protein
MYPTRSIGALIVCHNKMSYFYAIYKYKYITSFFVFNVEWNWVHYYWDNYWRIVLALDDDGIWWVWINRCNARQGKPKYLEKSCPSAALSTTNPIGPGPGSNQGLRGGKLSNNSLSYITSALQIFCIWSGCLALKLCIYNIGKTPRCPVLN